MRRVHDVPSALRRACTGLILAGLTACGVVPASRSRPPVQAPVDSAWAVTIADVRTAFGIRDFARADRALASFVARFPSSSAATEAAYWQALVHLDPGNRAANPATAAAALDAYRSTDPPRTHTIEADVLRALMVQLDSVRLELVLERTAAAAAANSAAGARAAYVPRDSLRARDEELARVRAEAATAQAELDRVRRRLTTPAGRGRRP